MSTRCQIEFREPNGDGRVSTHDRRTIYQHSDGYPQGEHGVIETMKAFFAWDRPHRGFDLEYTPANYIFWSKQRDIASLVRLDPEYTPEKAEDMAAHLGYGVCNNDEFHGDIAFFYEVEPAPRIQPSAHPPIIVRPYQVISRSSAPLVRSLFTPLAAVELPYSNGRPHNSTR